MTRPYPIHLRKEETEFPDRDATTFPPARGSACGLPVYAVAVGNSNPRDTTCRACLRTAYWREQHANQETES